MAVAGSDEQGWRAALGPRWQRAVAEVERMVGGRVVRAVRQARWRPAWDFDVERNEMYFSPRWRA
ncbi:MAG TPA: hypothetical protein PK156_51555, partial [Polyangium sp.]|nr:hypothetical protein [Polyangium sp.]